MNEVICLKCGTVFMGGGGKHCGDDAVPFDLAANPNANEQSFAYA